MKLLVIGFDGLCQELLLRTTFPLDVVRPMEVEIALSGPSWMTIYTGLSASEHGVVNALGYPAKDPYHNHKSYSDLKGKVVWDKIGAGGYTVALCNLPCAFPPRKVNGYHVAGYPAALKGDIAWPEDIVLPYNWQTLSDWGYSDSETPGSWAADILAMGTESALLAMAKVDSIAVTRWFVERSSGYDFGWLCLTFPDRVAHALGTRGDAQEGIVEATEVVLRELQALHPESWLVVSDHGLKLENDADGHAIHNSVGVMGARGTVASSVMDITYPSNLDVASLILRCFGLTTRASVMTDEEEREVLTRLAALGYVFGESDAS